ncbi:YHR182W [Saccharomyces arboricola H-6]|uniref:YHR182W n=1 Tax=Saccharomyces arboricola (strain H-6 / AS 2.3317 / CBS 10644) TaxID=1160507 RepID=J8Q189_SACAR|nr:YHR182W [Saccharomyces arboricola H-6]
MAANEHNEGNNTGNDFEKTNNLPIDRDSVKFLLRNTYWTKDYTTGIKLFIKHMREENDLVIRDINFYDDFTEKFWNPTLSHLQDLEPTNSMNKHLLEFMREFFNKISTDRIVSDCKTPLQKLKEHNEIFIREAENDLSSRYSVYIKDLVRVKDSLIECEKKIQSMYKLKKVKASTEDPSHTLNDDKDEPPLASSTFVCNFPYTFDEKLKFNNCNELMSFLKNLKKNVKSQKSIFSVPGLTNESFQGQSLIKKLKELEPKLDLSLFNTDRIGNEFIQLGIIKEYSLSFYSSKNSHFDQGKYYYWDSEIIKMDENNDNVTTRNKKSYGELTQSGYCPEEKPNVSSIKTSISDWIRKVSLHENDDCDASGSRDLNENNWQSLKQQLGTLQDRFYSRCCQLEYSKVQLEKTIYDYCRNYSRIEDRIQQTLKSSNKTFLQRCESFTEMPASFLQEDELPRRSADIEIRGFFLRDNGIPFRKWNFMEENDPVEECREITIKCEKFFCGSEINSDLTFLDTLGTIKTILRQIEKEPNTKKTIQSWHNDIDFVRVSNLKRDLLAKFRESKTMENTNSIITAQFLENSHIYVTNDFVGLIKVWLLELPDSLIPSKIYDTLVKTGKPLISLCEQFPTSSLRFLQELANHFQSINSGPSLPQQTLGSIFIDNGDIDIPLAHHFIRRTGLQNPADITILSPALYTFFASQDTSETLQELVTNDNTVTTTKATLAEPPIIIIKDTPPSTSSTPHPPSHEEDGPFIPRPFKTSSTTTTPEHAKRKSGLFLPINLNDRPPT